jgi:hypothetical protein
MTDGMSAVCPGDAVRCKFPDCRNPGITDKVIRAALFGQAIFSSKRNRSWPQQTTLVSVEGIMNFGDISCWTAIMGRKPVHCMESLVRVDPLQGFHGLGDERAKSVPVGTGPLVTRGTLFLLPQLTPQKLLLRHEYRGLKQRMRTTV